MTPNIPLISIPVPDNFPDDINYASAVGEILTEIVNGLSTAREKHPVLGENIGQALKAVESEQLEWKAEALLVENPDGTINMNRLIKAHAESMDTIITHLRFLLGDYPG